MKKQIENWLIKEKVAVYWNNKRVVGYIQSYDNEGIVVKAEDHILCIPHNQLVHVSSNPIEDESDFSLWDKLFGMPRKKKTSD